MSKNSVIGWKRVNGLPQLNGLALKRFSLLKIIPLPYLQNAELMIYQKKSKPLTGYGVLRPRLLFLASPGEITVYDLAQKPVAEKPG